jgi:quinolinate synthase
LSQEILDKIKVLKEERKAIILAHNYQPPEIQDMADVCGDSLGLSRLAAETDAEVIVFCGVRFMAETAAILSPGKAVLLPEEQAGCPMADMITVEQLRQQKTEYPDALVVCYVNSTAEVKAESDYCCTSANAVELVGALPRDRQILFVPDQNLGRFVIEKTGRDIVLWPGYCRSHVLISEDKLKETKAAFPDALVLAHPECTDPIKASADQVLSTGQMLKYVKTNGAKCFIVATEVGIIHALKKENPGARYIPASDKAWCENMKKISLEKVLWSLEDMKFQVSVPKETAGKARQALDRMIAV